MKRINFFNPFVEKKKKISKSQALFYLVLFFTVIGVLTTYFYNYTSIQSLENDIVKVEAFLNDPQNIEKTKTYKLMFDQIKLIEEYTTLTKPVVESIENDMKVNTYLFDSIYKASSGIASIEQMSYQDGTLTLSGKSIGKKLLANYLSNMKKTELFEFVTLDSMSLDGINYTYTMTCKFPGGEE
jgi:hypothetical protein